MHPLHQHINKRIPIENDEFERVMNCFVSEKFDKGQRIIVPGETVKHQYFVLKGCLRTFLIDPTGKEHTIQFAAENWWVSDYISYYQSNNSELTVECIESCELLKANIDALKVLFDELPKIERFFRLQLESAFVAFQTRILSNLHKNAKQRYEVFIEQYPHIEQRLKNYQIASFLGITPESLSRLRKERIASKK